MINDDSTNKSSYLIGKWVTKNQNSYAEKYKVNWFFNLIYFLIDVSTHAKLQ